MSWVLVASIKRVASTLRADSLKQGAGLSTLDSLSVHAVGDHLFGATSGVGEDTESLGRCLGASDVSSLQASAPVRSILGRLGHTSWFAAVDRADFESLTILSCVSVSRIKRVGASFRFSLNLSHIVVIVGSETASVLSGLMSLLSFSACNVINFHDIAGSATSHGVGLGLGLLDIIDLHGITDELRRSDRASLDIRKLIGRVQRVVGSSS